MKKILIKSKKARKKKTACDIFYDAIRRVPNNQIANESLFYKRKEIETFQSSTLKRTSIHTKMIETRKADNIALLVKTILLEEINILLDKIYIDYVIYNILSK